MKCKKNPLWLLLLFLMSASAVSSAQTKTARQAIEAAYAKRYQASEMLYLYGMRHARAEDFASTDVHGDKVDMDEFYSTWGKLMSQLLKAEWSGNVVSFEMLSDTKAKVVVADRFDALLRDPRYTAWAVASTVSVSEDIWELRDGEWLQVSSKVLKQNQKRTPYIKPGEKMLESPAGGQ